MTNNYLKKALLIISILLVTNSFAQVNPQIDWTKIYGGTGDEWAIDGLVTNDGGYVVLNTTWSRNGDVHNGHGTSNYEVWVVKTNSDGDTLWTNTYGGSSDEYARKIIQTADSGYVFLAETSSNDGDIDTNHGSWDFWVVKLNKTGQIQWQKTFGGTDGEDPRSVIQMPDGSYYVAGTAESVDGHLTGNNGQEDYWLLKLDANGNLIWQKNYGGDWTDLLKSISIANNEIYLVGYSWSDSTFDVTYPNIGYYDYWIQKVDTAGNKIWNRRLGSTGGDFAYSSLISQDTCLVIVGHVGTDDFDVDTTYGFYDYWLIKLDTAGNFKWKQSYGGNDDENVRKVVETSDGGFFITGFTWSTTGMVSGQHGGCDIWVVRTDNAGNLQWQIALGGSADEEGYCGINTTNNGYFITGYTASNNSGDVGTAKGNGDSWLVKLLCSPQYNASVCMVMFDSTFRKNKVVWEDAGYPANIQSVNVYRSTGVTGVYSLIGNVPVDSLSEYVDTAVSINPYAQSFRYKVAAVDSCGNVSDTSSAHRTVVLTASPSGTNDINLIWNDYEGFTASSYKIYRYTQSAPTPTLIATLPAGSSPYIDLNAPQNDTARYYINIVPPTACTSSKNYNEGRSNTAANAIATLGVQNNAIIKNVAVLPNPSAGEFSLIIESGKSGENFVIDINNIAGQKVYTTNLITGSAIINKSIDLTHLPKGVYFLYVKSSDDSITKKIILR